MANNADWANKDFYKVLGVAKDAEPAAIKKAYRKLARENHPDSRPGDQAAEDRFKQVAEAYDVVGDAEKRKQYDEMRTMFAGAGAGGGFGGFPGGFGGQTSGGSGGFDVSDLFGDLFNQGGGRSTGFGNRSRAPRPAKGADVETETSLDFRSAVDGTTISMRLRSDAPCPTCSGTGGKPGTRPHICGTCDGAGMVVNSVGGGFSMNETCPECHGRQLVYDEPCPTCHGSGRGFSDRTVSARIPAGVKDGQRIRLKGKGAAGENGGPNGDLLVTVHVKPHHALRSQGRQPHPRGPGHLRRGRARRRDQGAHPRRRPRHPADRARHPERTGPPGARSRCTAQGRFEGRPARHRRGPGARHPRRRRPRRGHRLSRGPSR